MTDFIDNTTMIKLKDILTEAKKAPSIFIPRRVEDRLERYIKNFIKYQLNNPFARLMIDHMDLVELPEMLNGIEMKGAFICSGNNLLTLKNCPKVVGGFGCKYNNLSSLIDGPEVVKGDYICIGNKLENLVGAPDSVDGSFNCKSNRLKSLEGAPKFVGRDFDCSYNSGLESLVGIPKHIGGNFILEDNIPVGSSEARFKEEDVRKLSDVKGKVQFYVTI